MRRFVERTPFLMWPWGYAPTQINTFTESVIRPSITGSKSIISTILLLTFPDHIPAWIKMYACWTQLPSVYGAGYIVTATLNWCLNLLLVEVSSVQRGRNKCLLMDPIDRMPDFTAPSCVNSTSYILTNARNLNISKFPHLRFRRLLILGWYWLTVRGSPALQQCGEFSCLFVCFLQCILIGYH